MMSKPKMPNYRGLETRKPRITKYGYCHWCYEPRHKNSPDTDPNGVGWCSFRCGYDEISTSVFDLEELIMCNMCGVKSQGYGENCHPDCTIWSDGEDDDFFII